MNFFDTAVTYLLVVYFKHVIRDCTSAVLVLCISMLKFHTWSTRSYQNVRVDTFTLECEIFVVTDLHRPLRCHHCKQQWQSSTTTVFLKTSATCFGLSYKPSLSSTLIQESAQLYFTVIIQCICIVCGIFNKFSFHFISFYFILYVLRTAALNYYTV